MDNSKKCYLCNKNGFIVRPGEVRDNLNVKIIECINCGLVTLSDFNHINERHYEEGKMHDDGISIAKWRQETYPDDDRRFEMLKNKLIGKKLLDFGCGNGGFLIKAKPFTSTVNGVELEERLQPYFEENELVVYKSLDEAISNVDVKYDIITSFHVFEHLFDPAKMLLELSKLLSEQGEIIIEVPSSDDALLTLFNNVPFSKFTYWSQHLFLFNQHTITELVKKSGLRLNWVKQVQRYSLSNHLYWLAKGQPGGHKVWAFFDDINLDKAYAQQLASIGKCDTILISVSL